ncbi:MAG: type pilus assembly protein PilM [Phycisphaerales bacterium]|nr:type pilus assembly protein PilM [Phycisphaerales bacterium]
MLWLGKTKRSPIGIDVGRREIKAVQLARGSGTLRVAAGMLLPRPDDGITPLDAEMLRLGDALERGGFTGRQIVLAVPGDKLISSVLELPRSNAVPVAQMARMELARNHRCPPDSLEMGCWELPAAARAAKSAQVMAVACRHDDANAILDRFEDAGLDVVGLDVRACALARVTAPLASADGGVTATLELGWTAATLVLLYRGNVVYERKVADAGFDHLHAELCKKLHVETDVADYLLAEAGLGGTPDDPNAAPPDARALITAHLESLAADVSASLSYAAHQYDDAGIASLLLCGAGAAVPGVDRHLAGLLRIAARKVGPADIAPCPPGRSDACTSPASLVAMGLAMFEEQ